jgi:hypothetical protein
MEKTHSNKINIPHLSPSTVNSWIENKYGFYNSKVLKKPFIGSAAMSRGKAIEFAINEWLKGVVQPAQLQRVAESNFIEECKESNVDINEVLAMKPSIAGLIEVAYKVYSEILPTGYLSQIKININLPGVQRSIIGYMDYHKPSVLTRDCKVVNRTPPKLSQGYVLQGSVYRYATTVNTVFDFFVDNKKPIHKCIELSDEEYAHGISYLTKACIALEELEECTDPERVMHLMSFPNLDAMWNEADVKEACDAWEIVYPPFKKKDD